MLVARSVRWLIVFTFALPILGHSQSTTPYPAKPIRLIVPFAPGGGTDILARSLGQLLGSSLGQQVIVDNRPGAGGVLGADLTAKSAPDGYTIMMVSSSYSVNPALYKLSFDPIKDLTPISQVASVPFVLVAHPSVPINNLRELIALAKAKPGQLNFASSGLGSSPHLAGEYFNMRAGTQIKHIPYKGGGPAIADVMGGHVQFLFSTVVQGIPHIKSESLKAIAIGSLKRSAALPDVPTIAESGIPGYDVTNWFGILGPRDMPRQIVEKLSTEIAKHLRNTEFMAKLAAEGAEPVGSTPAEFAQLISSEIEKYGRIVKETQIKVD
ncbi:MAG: tripartite tricarboxylate transporter substrate binding protein [Burkholderiaceae bacterium]